MFFVSFLKIRGLECFTVSYTSFHIIEREHFWDIWDLWEKAISCSAPTGERNHLLNPKYQMTHYLSSLKWFFSMSLIFVSYNFPVMVEKPSEKRACVIWILKVLPKSQELTSRLDKNKKTSQLGALGHSRAPIPMI